MDAFDTAGFEAEDFGTADFDISVQRGFAGRSLEGKTPAARG
jgi:hypothetical protein